MIRNRSKLQRHVHRPAAIKMPRPTREIIVVPPRQPGSSRSKIWTSVVIEDRWTISTKASPGPYQSGLWRCRTYLRTAIWLSNCADRSCFESGNKSEPIPK
ncbi:uncharacterized protein LOC129742306 [Uranotaenia lowii]|uniref:uncharacterized protein LOC129742306 n=1 Tax=Uranotaenia lowii TaxID=190385 RepID=UPI00247A1721|nr:uncharacterized protein LOC129742306 [Uranotaenia lowii]